MGLKAVMSSGDLDTFAVMMAVLSFLPPYMGSMVHFYSDTVRSVDFIVLLAGQHTIFFMVAYSDLGADARTSDRYLLSIG
ncbi:hypothetical protein [Streptococcus chenjunshii]|uniref:hypothetical protein n=1 Tax=Streptococcus chenjunshii TaxID=2173853 RepID=UPI00115ED02B|nr:hypothetical protein [Streptococcus chenjunshii]